jgi:glycosyltransferase involved in cell wall biosynthesis
VVPLAVDEAFVSAGRAVEPAAATRERLSLPPRYIVFAGRYDARKDMRTLFQALALVGTRATDRHGEAASPALVVALPGATEGEDGLVRAAAAASGVSKMVSLVTVVDARRRAAVVGGADAFVYPCLSEATALPALEALALGVPVIGSRAGALPETVGSAGIVVEPRDPNRLAAAIEAIWSGGALAEQLLRQARKRAESSTRTWSDVARETREVYAAALGDEPPRQP